MAETADDLSAPLGQEMAQRKRRYRLPFTGMQALAVLLGLFLVAFAGFAIFNDNPLGGEPIKRLALSQASPRRMQNPQPNKLHRPTKRPSPSSTVPAARATKSRSAAMPRKKPRTRPMAIRRLR